MPRIVILCRARVKLRVRSSLCLIDADPAVSQDVCEDLPEGSNAVQEKPQDPRHLVMNAEQRFPSPPFQSPA